MAIADDFEIQNDKDVRYTGSTANYTVLALHRWLQDTADDASVATANDFMDISRDTPSDRSFDTIINLINGFNIDATAAQHLYGGSIIQTGGAEIFDGIQVLAPAGMRLEIIQNGALVSPNFWTTGLNADAPNGISHQFILKVRTASADIDGRRLIGTSREFGKLYLEFKVNGTARGVNVLAFTGWADDLNNATAEGTVSGWSDVVNLSAGYNGIDVDNDTVDEYFYSEWDRASRTINQFYERMKWLVRRGTASTLYGLSGDLFRGITHQFAYDTEAGGPFTEGAEVTWTVSGTPSTGQLLALKDDGATGTMWIQVKTGIPPVDPTTISQTGGKTCEVNGTVTERSVSAPFCGQSTGTSIIGAFGFGVQATDLGVNDKVFDLANALWQAPNFVTFTVGGLAYPNEDYVLVGPIGYRFDYDNEQSGPFAVGDTLTFTAPAGTAKLAELIDRGSAGEMIIGPMTSGSVPQNNSTIANQGTATADVNGTVNNSVDTRQLTLNGLLNGGAVVSVVVNEAIPTDTPATGTIRILRASGKKTRHPYSAINYGTKTFTITSHDFSTDNAANGAGVFITYIDVLADAASEAFTGVFLANRTLFIRVRDGGSTPIKTFESTGVLTSAGGSATAVRTSDA